MTVSISQASLHGRPVRKVRLPAMLFALGRACAAAGTPDRGPVPGSSSTAHRAGDPPRRATQADSTAGRAPEPERG